MKAVPFDPSRDLETMPFTLRHAELAKEMKRLGIDWHPHVGCFVWDPEGYIRANSPFPQRIYFILSLPRFIEIFGTIAAMAEYLVWMPTWHQTRLLCRRYQMPDEISAKILIGAASQNPGEELIALYNLIIDFLRKRSG